MFSISYYHMPLPHEHARVAIFSFGLRSSKETTGIGGREPFTCIKITWA